VQKRAAEREKINNFNNHWSSESQQNSRRGRYQENFRRYGNNKNNGSFRYGNDRNNHYSFRNWKSARTNFSGRYIPNYQNINRGYLNKNVRNQNNSRRGVRKNFTAHQSDRTSDKTNFVRTQVESNTQSQGTAKVKVAENSQVEKNYSTFQNGIKLPIINVKIKRQYIQSLVDSGSSINIISDAYLHLFEQ